MTFSLRRTRDDAGDSGPLFQMFKLDENDKVVEVKGKKPEIGCAIRVGSPYARSYSAQDYWTTTPVTEILEEKIDKENDQLVVRFKTGNSEYVWTGFIPE